jgi:hypothetical protein
MPQNDVAPLALIFSMIASTFRAEIESAGLKINRETKRSVRFHSESVAFGHWICAAPTFCPGFQAGTAAPALGMESPNAFTK